MAVIEDPPSIEVPEAHDQDITWQPLGRVNSVFRPHKPLPRKRDTTISSITSPDLRAQYRSSSNGALNGDIYTNGTHERPGSSLMHSPTTPVLPPTPPIANHENSDYSHDESSIADTTILRSSVVTPINQQSPPTPDQTPPRIGKDLVLRPWLATQPSMASTLAESFATAREEFQSDTESERSAQRWIHSRSRNASHQTIPVPKVPDEFQSKLSPLADATPRTPRAVWEDDEVWNSLEVEQEYEEIAQGSQTQDLDPEVRGQQEDDELEEPVLASSNEELPQYEEDWESNAALDEEQEEHKVVLDRGAEFDSPTLPHYAFITPSRDEAISEEQVQDVPKSVESSSSFRSRLPRPVVNVVQTRHIALPQRKMSPRRGPSLRERLEAVDRGLPSASIENFADQIGWAESDGNMERSNPQQSWRHSGLSTISTVDAMVFDTEPKRTKTIRRQAKTKSLRAASSPLSESNRSSILTNPYAVVDSPPKHSLSHKKARLSNQNRMSYGSDASRSLSISSAATPSKAEVIRVAVIPERRSSLQSSGDSSRRHSTARSLSSNERRRFPSLHHNTHTHRLSSDGASIGPCNTCGNSTRYPPPIPPRGSSLSAPSSRNNSKVNSRSNSIASDHLRVHRLQAEHDLRKTLDRMESERMAPTVKAMAGDAENSAEPSPPEPGTEKWASLRPTSVLETPLSQPSVLTASGDGASIGEARAVNLFPHNNDSLQLIEKHPLVESHAVRSLRHTKPIRNLSILIDDPPTPRTVAAGVPAVDSPLRNPREPPPTPAVQVVPPAPTVFPSMPVSRSKSSGQPIKRYSSRRPSVAAHRYSGSFIKSVTRGLSLKNARNPKSDSPQLDEKQMPMWRPRRFWDDAEYTEDESESYSEDDGEIRNTVGMPHKRTVVNGPVSLMRSLSENSRARKQQHSQRRFLYKQSSYGSMSRLMAARKLYKIPGFRGVHFQFVSPKIWQERMRLARNRKEDEKREERRRLLREAIGPEVVSQGDSRFPNPPTGMVDGRNRNMQIID